jgi:hypothetical protein
LRWRQEFEASLNYHQKKKKLKKERKVMANFSPETMETRKQ